MKGKDIALELCGAVAGTLIKKTPDLIEQMTKKKEEKSFFESNKGWIFLIILAIFVTNFYYINIFDNVVVNSIVNIIYGSIIFILLFLFYYEERNVFKINSYFIKFLIISIFILGIINSFYHICCSVINFLKFIL